MTTVAAMRELTKSCSYRCEYFVVASAVGGTRLCSAGHRFCLAPRRYGDEIEEDPVDDVSLLSSARITVPVCRRTRRIQLLACMTSKGGPARDVPDIWLATELNR